MAKNVDQMDIFELVDFLEATNDYCGETRYIRKTHEAAENAKPVTKEECEANCKYCYDDNTGNYYFNRNRDKYLVELGGTLTLVPEDIHGKLDFTEVEVLPTPVNVEIDGEEFQVSKDTIVNLDPIPKLHKKYDNMVLANYINVLDDLDVDSSEYDYIDELLEQ